MLVKSPPPLCRGGGREGIAREATLSRFAAARKASSWPRRQIKRRLRLLAPDTWAAGCEGIARGDVETHFLYPEDSALLGEKKKSESGFFSDALSHVSHSYCEFSRPTGGLEGKREHSSVTVKSKVEHRVQMKRTHVKGFVREI